MIGFAGVGARAQSTNATDAALDALVKQIQVKADAGKRAEADFSDEIKAFDDLMARENGAKTDEAAHIAYLKARLYSDVFGNFDKAKAAFDQVSGNYPHTSYGRTASEAAGEITSIEAEQKLQDEEMNAQIARFHVGEPFPDFNEKSLNGRPISLAGYKGRVVLIDFWATWCPPCLIELPNVIATYQKYHDKGLEIIGVSLDDDHDKLADFLKKHSDLVWPQYFDEKGSENKLVTKYGIKLIPFTVLIGPDGRIINTNLRGEALDTAVGAALAKK
jgi:thiol-disulfide isomerase/thioredoxin